MTHWKLLILAAGVLLAGAAIWSAPQKPAAKAPEVLQLTGDAENVHDPVIIKEGDTYYVYCTGGGRGGQGVIPIRTSKDVRTEQKSTRLNSSHLVISYAVFCLKKK